MAEADPPTQMPRAKTQPDEPPLPLVRIRREVFAAELEKIIGSRATRFPEPKRKKSAGPEEGRPDAERELKRVREASEPAVVPKSCGLVGLALSGGGIRSASVCLGVMQRLAEAGLLRFVDYLSTVSGGGYIGSSWTALLTKSDGRTVEQPPDFPFVHVPAKESKAVLEDKSAADNEEPAALLHVRDFANYLVPTGLRDYAKAPVLVLRGLIINALLLLPYLLLLSALTIAYGAWIDAWILENDTLDIWAEASALAPRLVFTPWLAVICFVFLIGVTALQAALRRILKRSGTWEKRASWLAVGTLLSVALIGVLLLELQPYLVWQFRLTTEEGGLLSEPDLWATLTMLLGTASIVGAALGATAGRIKRQLAFWAVGLAGPLSFYIAFLYFCRLPIDPALQEALWVVTVPVERLGASIGFAEQEHWLWCVGYIAVAFLLLVWSWCAVDVNAASLHNYYRDRLSRAFMIGVARNPKSRRWGAAHYDTIKLSEVDAAITGGPYHLINVTANSPDFSASGRLGHLGQRGRRAEFFIMSPQFCGNERLGYCRSNDLEEADPHVNIATAMAISAAAAAPNMGQKSFNPLITFLFGMLNIRLGYWLPKPKSVREKQWFRFWVGPLYFLAELIGIPPHGDRAYINLSDGGHLENLGVFELLRRRCRYIIAIDAEADPTMTFNGLATLQRLAKIDLGVEIHFDVEDLRHQSSKLSRRHFTLARIEYGDGDWGELLYIKSSLTGTEIEYIKEYVSRHQDFPHESTGDQFFDEAQFEAYRALGYKIGNELVPDLDTPAAGTHKDIDTYFQRWREVLRPAAPFRDAFLRLPSKRLDLDLRLHDAERSQYLEEIYRDLPIPAGADAAHESGMKTKSLDESAAKFRHRRAAQALPAADEPVVDFHLLQLVNEQMQLMEQAVLSLHLNERTNQNHPRNRGWINLFRRWAKSPIFRKYWAISIANYSDILLIFCKYALNICLEVDWRPGGQPTEAEAKFLSRVETGESSSIWHGFVAPSPEVSEDQPKPTVSTGTGPASEHELPTCVAVALVENVGDKSVLRAFRIREPYRNLRLSEPLLRELARVASGDGDLLYRFDDDETEPSRRLQRVISRIDRLRAAKVSELLQQDT